MSPFIMTKQDEERLAKLEREVAILKEQWSCKQRKKKVVSFGGQCDHVWTPVTDHDGEWTNVLHCAKCKKVKGTQ